MFCFNILLFLFLYTGCTWEFAAMVGFIKKTQPQTKLIVVGFSLGGNIVCKFLGENRTNQERVLCCVSVCQGYSALRWAALFPDRSYIIPDVAPEGVGQGSRKPWAYSPDKNAASLLWVQVGPFYHCCQWTPTELEIRTDSVYIVVSDLKGTGGLGIVYTCFLRLTFACCMKLVQSKQSVCAFV